MNTKSSAKPVARAKELRINEQKWSKPLMDAGWTAMTRTLRVEWWSLRGY